MELEPEASTPEIYQFNKRESTNSKQNKKTISHQLTLPMQWYLDNRHPEKNNSTQIPNHGDTIPILPVSKTQTNTPKKMPSEGQTKYQHNVITNPTMQTCIVSAV
ncbi:hypothetical protein VTN49DRAFT_1007 [Thermomyces lanuginosus]|uniref:uncharacterized protein n=1 Tax=Thermomyces lanuginosus TaxID=5541 RepID=UPI003742A00F